MIEDLEKLKSLFKVSYLSQSDRYKYRLEAKQVAWLIHNGLLQLDEGPMGLIKEKELKALKQIASKGRRQKLVDNQLVLMHIAYLEDKRVRMSRGLPRVEDLRASFIKGKAAEVEKIAALTWVGVVIEEKQRRASRRDELRAKWLKKKKL